jgi:hypothetical protein
MHQYADEVCLDIANVAKALELSSNQFRPIDPYEEWKSIEDNIYRRFVKYDFSPERPVWLWEYFFLPVVSMSLPEWPNDLLERIIVANEHVWFFVNGRNNKFWFYEGLIAPINRVVHESCEIDEFYVCSKKYQWLLCINHHDNLIVTGDLLPETLRRLQMNNR